MHAVRLAIGPQSELYRRCQRRLLAQAGAASWPSVRRPGASPGSRNRSPRTTCRGCGWCATGRRPGWPSRPASTATTARTSGGCWTPGRWTFLQADATRCGGITGFLASRRSARGATACRSRPTARPRCMLHPCCAAGPVSHLEYFHDHVRIERMLFDGLPESRVAAAPDLPGAGQRARAARGGRRPIRDCDEPRRDGGAPERRSARTAAPPDRRLLSAAAASALPLGAEI